MVHLLLSIDKILVSWQPLDAGPSCVVNGPRQGDDDKVRFWKQIIRLLFTKTRVRRIAFIKADCMLLNDYLCWFNIKIKIIQWSTLTPFNPYDHHVELDTSMHLRSAIVKILLEVFSPQTWGPTGVPGKHQLNQRQGTCAPKCTATTAYWAYN